MKALLPPRAREYGMDCIFPGKAAHRVLPQRHVCREVTDTALICSTDEEITYYDNKY